MVLLSKGNANLNCSGVDESTNTLRFGLQLDEKNNINSSLKVITASKSWSKDFHTFQFLWRPDSFMFKIDGQRHSFNSSKLDKMLFSSEVRHYWAVFILYHMIIIILMYIYLELFIHWCVSWWHEKFP